MSSSGARFGIWISSNSTASCQPPTGEWSFQVLHREVWTRVLGTGRGRTAHERLEGVIDRGLQNRTDAEEAARREEAPYRMRPSTGPNLRRFWHPARYAFLSEAEKGARRRVISQAQPYSPAGSRFACRRSRPARVKSWGQLQP